jgi:putative ABC transport system permease protein
MKFLRQILESFRFAWQALSSNILRTTLSLLGVTIGIFSIIAVLTMVDSMSSSITSQLESFGKGVVYVGKWPWEFSNSYPWWKYMNRPNTKFSEFKYLQENVANQQAIAIIDGRNRVTFKNGSNSMESGLTGCSYEYDKISDITIRTGRYFLEREADNGNSVILIGSSVADNLFQERDPIGEDIKVNGIKFKVIGVLKKKGKDLLNSLGGNDPDAQAFIPYKSFANIFQKDEPQPDVAMKALDSDAGQIELEGEVTGLMRGIRGLKPRDEVNFAINRLDGATKFFEGVFLVLTIAGWVIGSFSILVGGFGIANIMFVSVKERTNIIGIQKSLGAQNYFIMFQFLFEAVFLSLIGGLFGLFFVYLITFIELESFDIVLTTRNIIIGLGVSSTIGILSGIIPAFMAARLDPVIAIRSK